MRIVKLSIEIRRPTVQYGYDNYLYEVEIDETDESVENVIRHIQSEHDQAIKSVELDRENRRKLKRSTKFGATMPFD